MMFVSASSALAPLLLLYPSSHQEEISPKTVWSCSRFILLKRRGGVFDLLFKFSHNLDRTKLRWAGLVHESSSVINDLNQHLNHDQLTFTNTTSGWASDLCSLFLCDLPPRVEAPEQLCCLIYLEEHARALDLSSRHIWMGWIIDVAKKNVLQLISNTLLLLIPSLSPHPWFLHHSYSSIIHSSPSFWSLHPPLSFYVFQPECSPTSTTAE